MHQNTTPRSLVVLSGLAAGSVLVGTGLVGCATTGSSTTADNTPPARNESPIVLQERDPADQIMSINFGDLFPSQQDPFMSADAKDNDAWPVIENTSFAERNPAPAYTKKTDAANAGPNLAANLYGQLMETPGTIPQRSEDPGFQTSNSRQVTFTGEGSDFDPIVSKDGRYIIYASTQHSSTADIYIKQVDSRVITRLTTDPGQDVMPSLSPDGTRIAFASNRSGNWDIWVMPITGGKAIQVSMDQAHELHPSWSPDGSHLVFSRLGTSSGRWELWVSDPYDALASQHIGYGLFPEWSPVAGTGVNGGDKILFQRSRERGGRTFGVWTLDYNLQTNQAGHETQIVSDPDLAYINPSFSPDGMWVTYSAIPNPEKWIGSGPEFSPPSASVWMIGMDGRGEMPLTQGGTVDLMPAWSPDGTVFFVSNRTGHENLWSVDASPALLTASGGSPFFNNDTTGLAGEVRRVNPNANNRDSFATVPTDQP